MPIVTIHINTPKLWCGFYNYIFFIVFVVVTFCFYFYFLDPLPATSVRALSEKRKLDGISKGDKYLDPIGTSSTNSTKTRGKIHDVSDEIEIDHIGNFFFFHCLLYMIHIVYFDKIVYILQLDEKHVIARGNNK